MQSELKPCPFCGSDRLMVLPPTCDRDTPYSAADRAYPVVRCSGCYTDVPGRDFDASSKSAVEAWNRRAALVDVPAVESEPVAWTSPGQLREIERGANGIVTKYGDEFMSVPLYSDPPRSLSNEGETERTLGELLQLRVAESGAAYCQSLRQFEQIPCLGWERKAKDGAYGEAEHAAHRKANELMGQHQGLARAVKILRDALSALAATRSASATTATGGNHG